MPAATSDTGISVISSSASRPSLIWNTTTSRASRQRVPFGLSVMDVLRESAAFYALCALYAPRQLRNAALRRTMRDTARSRDAHAEDDPDHRLFQRHRR